MVSTFPNGMRCCPLLPFLPPPPPPPTPPPHPPLPPPFPPFTHPLSTVEKASPMTELFTTTLLARFVQFISRLFIMNVFAS